MKEEYERGRQAKDCEARSKKRDETDEAGESLGQAGLNLGNVVWEQLAGKAGRVPRGLLGKKGRRWGHGFAVLAVAGGGVGQEGPGCANGEGAGGQYRRGGRGALAASKVPSRELAGVAILRGGAEAGRGTGGT